MTTLEDRLRRDLPDLARRLVPGEPGGQPLRSTAEVEPPGVDLDLNPRPPHHRRLLALAAALVLLVAAVAGFAWLRQTDSPGGEQVAGPGSTDAPPASAATSVGSPVDPGTWRSLATAPIGPRAYPVAAWTGDRMLVWAGSNLDRSFAFTDGAVYDPATDTWQRLPTPGWGHPGLTSAWFDGALYALAKGSGTRFDPATGAWTDLPPVENMFLAATVAGDDALWGLGPPTSNPSGQTDVAIARLDPATNTWAYGPVFEGTDETGSAFPSFVDGGAPALWTGSEIVLWTDGVASPALDAATETWRVLPALEPPGGGTVTRSTATVTDEGLTVVARVEGDGDATWHLAVLTADGWSWRGAPLPLDDAKPITLGAAGSWLLVLPANQEPVAVHVPTGDWSVAPGPLGNPSAPAVVWTGSELLVWGGIDVEPPAGPGVYGAAWRPPS